MRLWRFIATVTLAVAVFLAATAFGGPASVAVWVVPEAGAAAPAATRPTSAAPAGNAATDGTAADRNAAADGGAADGGAAYGGAADGTPVARHGQLRVCGVRLCDQQGDTVQLRGMSTHGLQWFADCYHADSVAALADDWRVDLLRIAMYVQEGGYETDPAGFTRRVNRLVDLAESRGLYAIVDFHTLTPGDPNHNLERAKAFFRAVSARNAAKPNVIYEIANEPNGVGWAAVRSYAEQVIPVIRANDPDAVVIVGTRGWSSLGVSDGSGFDEVTADPVRASNIMYAFHFYAASHRDNYRAEVRRAAASLPLFVSEFGTVNHDGGGAVDVASSTAWLDLLDQLKIGYTNWTFSDASEGSAALRPGTCGGVTYAGTRVLTESGAFMRDRIRTR